MTTTYPQAVFVVVYQCTTSDGERADDLVGVYATSEIAHRAALMFNEGTAETHETPPYKVEQYMVFSE